VLSSTAVGHLRSDSGRSLLLLLLVVFAEEDALGVEMELEAVDSGGSWICRGSARPGRCKGGRLRGGGRSGGT
jgi:hypothetical protein